MDPFAALADPVRRELLRTLLRGPARVVDLAAAYSISRPAASKHLRLLTEAGLSTVENHGRERHYALAPDGLQPVAELLDQLRARAPLDEHVLDGLELEVRRTVRERRAVASPAAEPTERPEPGTHQEEPA